MANQQALVQLSDTSNSLSGLALTILVKDQYVVWKKHTQTVFKAKGLFRFLEEDIDENDPKELYARGLLEGALDLENRLKTINCRTTKEIWMRLEMDYENKSGDEIQSLYQDLYGYKIHSLKDISIGISHLESLRARLDLCGERISDQALMSAIMSALPTSLDYFRPIWRATTNEDKTLKNLTSRLIAEAQVQANKTDEKALLSASQKAEENSGRQGQFREKSGPTSNESHTKEDDNEKNQCKSRLGIAL